MLNILKKEENRNILSNDDTFNLWINKYNDKKEEKEEKEEIEKKKGKAKYIPIQKNIQINPSITETSLNGEKNCNNSLKSNNSFHNLDNTYRKKMPISPAYPKKNNFIPSSEINDNKHIKEN